jgi:hypothetical protein
MDRRDRERENEIKRNGSTAGALAWIPRHFLPMFHSGATWAPPLLWFETGTGQCCRLLADTASTTPTLFFSAVKKIRLAIILL